MKCNSEVGMWNSELIEKEDFTSQNSPFRIPKSSLTHCSIIPTFHYSSNCERPVLCSSLATEGGSELNSTLPHILAISAQSIQRESNEMRD